MKSIIVYLILTLLLVLTIEYVSDRPFYPFFEKTAQTKPLLRKQLGANGVTLYYPISVE